MEDIDNNQNLIATDHQWTLVRSPTGNTGGMSTKQSPHELFFFLWTSEEEEMSSFTLAACQSLSSDPPAWPGIKLNFQSDPSPGFSLEIAKGWEPVNSLQEEELFKKLVWEIKRAQGNS